ncbi:unnamed protein product [Soboliphyme baturini]|uniref:Secreted protein n=1 Tax=Soboliphyme baturini TaxID=241478 RepID=A0A183IH29_9BILA|nr:unnamed protein product [Soboliphyme baturini]
MSIHTCLTTGFFSTTCYSIDFYILQCYRGQNGAFSWWTTERTEDNDNDDLSFCPLLLRCRCTGTNGASVSRSAKIYGLN